jgi:hypothetical protein
MAWWGEGACCCTAFIWVAMAVQAGLRWADGVARHCYGWQAQVNRAEGPAGKKWWRPALQLAVGPHH